MSKITRNNYEGVFIDYFDGSLNNHEIAELMLFLAQNSDLDKEFNQFEFVTLKEDKINFASKETLKKQDATITGSVLFDKCIDKIENNLTNEQTISFENELKLDVNIRTELENFNKTIIKPDFNITFKQKASLKQKVINKFYLKSVYQYAAVFIAIFISYILIKYNTEFKQISNNTTNKQIASVVNFGELSSFDKYDNQQAFTVIKRETPKIVAKSNSKTVSDKRIIKPVHINKLNAKLFVVDESLANNSIPVYRHNKPNFKLLEVKTKYDNSFSDSKVKELDKKCNPTMVKAITNELKSDVYISEMMLHYKKIDAKSDKESGLNTKTVWQVLSKKISELTGANMETSYNENGKVSMLAVNTNRFRLSKKIRK